MNEITLTLPKLYPLQQTIVDDSARFKAIMAGRHVGKTSLVQHVSIVGMLKKLRVC